MTTSYDENRDVLDFHNAEHRGIAPARFAQAITPPEMAGFSTSFNHLTA